MKGFWRTIESVMAVIILASFLLSISSFYFSVEENGMSSVGYGMLKELDSRNELRPYAASMDYETIRSKIKILGHNHSVRICDYVGNCTGYYPDSGNVVVSTYLISGHDRYEPLEVRLYMW